MFSLRSLGYSLTVILVNTSFFFFFRLQSKKISVYLLSSLYPPPPVTASSECIGAPPSPLLPDHNPFSGALATLHSIADKVYFLCIFASSFNLWSSSVIKFLHKHYFPLTLPIKAIKIGCDCQPYYSFFSSLICL